MNLKRKLWWAQHRTDVYKYSTIILLFLIVTISIIYFTYSKFSSSNEMTMYETTVEPFIKNDDFIASYIDGEWSNEIPGKNDGYIVDKIVCDNGAVGTWDNEEWGINIRNATQKIKCGVYFKKLAKLTEQIITLASTDITNFATDDPDNNIRYIGKNANSYIYFNCSDYSNQNDNTCEKWKIIGLFKNVTKSDGTKEDLVKIVGVSSFSHEIWFDSDGTFNGTNNWSTSTLMNMLNNNYYNSGPTTKGYFYRDGDKLEFDIDFTSTGLKNDLTRNAIESVVWNLGGNSTLLDATAEKLYNYERSSNVYDNNPVSWTGKIALSYLSDVVYSIADGSLYTRAQCLEQTLSSWSIGLGGLYDSCLNNVNYSGKNWFLDISNENNYGVAAKTPGTFGFFQSVRDDSMISYYIDPTLYLKSNIIIISGDGSKSNPYQLKL